MCKLYTVKLSSVSCWNSEIKYKNTKKSLLVPLELKERAQLFEYHGQYPCL